MLTPPCPPPWNPSVSLPGTVLCHLYFYIHQHLYDMGFFKSYGVSWVPCDLGLWTPPALLWGLPALLSPAKPSQLSPSPGS